MTRNSSGNYINFPQFTHSCYLPFPQERVNEEFEWFSSAVIRSALLKKKKKFLLCVSLLGLFVVEGPASLLRLGVLQGQGIYLPLQPGSLHHQAGEPSEDPLSDEGLLLSSNYIFSIKLAGPWERDWVSPLRLAASLST